MFYHISETTTRTQTQVCYNVLFIFAEMCLVDAYCYTFGEKTTRPHNHVCYNVLFIFAEMCLVDAYCYTFGEKTTRPHNHVCYNVLYMFSEMCLVDACYYTFSEKTTMIEAQAACNALGANLVVITDEPENNIIQQLVQRLCHCLFFFIYRFLYASVIINNDN